MQCWNGPWVHSSERLYFSTDVSGLVELSKLRLYLPEYRPRRLQAVPLKAGLKGAWTRWFAGQLTLMRG
jgi:hypothetical protein